MIKHFFVTKFVGGLKTEVKATIKLHKPRSIDAAFSLAKTQEELLGELGFLKAFSKQSFREGYKSFNKARVYWEQALKRIRRLKKSPSGKRGLIHSRQLEEPEVNALNVERNLAQGTSVQNLCNFRCWRNFWKYFKIKKKSLQWWKKMKAVKKSWSYLNVLPLVQWVKELLDYTGSYRIRSYSF